jgi:Domain of unknown function (DUF4338)/DDE_Tnp_1-associated/Transposase DDE domain
VLIREHYLHSADLVGEQLRYVAEYQGRWLALLGWSAGAYHLKDRDAWLGWTPAQRSRRLPLVANNSRFWILDDAHYPNLATRAMKLCLDRLPSDWQAAYDHPILLAESFVDRSLFGTCYRAGNWQLLGFTKGYRRARADYYTRHDKPKQLWVKELKPGYRELMKSRRLPEWLQELEAGQGPACAATEEELCGMVKYFETIPDWRTRLGDYPVAGLVAVVASATLSGVQRGQRDLAAFAATLTPGQMQALGFRKRGHPRQYTPPKETTFFRLLSKLDSQKLQEALLVWQEKVLGPRSKDDKLLAFDGKKLRSSQGLEITSLYAVKSGRWLGSELTENKSNEIPAARKILRRTDIEGCLVAGDALHSNTETAHLIVQEKGADYLQPIKGNQKTLEENLSALQQNLQSAFSPSTGH